MGEFLPHVATKGIVGKGNWFQQGKCFNENYDDLNDCPNTKISLFVQNKLEEEKYLKNYDYNHIFILDGVRQRAYPVTNAVVHGYECWFY